MNKSGTQGVILKENDKAVIPVRSAGIHTIGAVESKYGLRGRAHGMTGYWVGNYSLLALSSR
jgi:hypothetical protein